MPNKNDGSRVARKTRSRERNVNANSVPGFPEIVALNTRCRLCGLAETNAVLLRYIHDLFLGGKGVRALETETRQAFINEPMNVKCFSRHFQGHVDFAAVSVAALAEVRPLRSVPPPAPVLAPTPVLSPVNSALVPAAVVAPVLTPEDEEAMETAAYFDMRNLITKLRARMETVDQSTSFVDDKGKVNAYGLQLWLKFVDTFRSALEAMNRIKNNDKLTKAILQAHAKRQTQMAGSLLVTRLETVLAKMRTGSPDALHDLEQFATLDAKALILEAARHAVEESCEVYKLN